MGEANEGNSRSMEMENLGVEISDQYPRDLLQTFMGRNPNEKARAKQEVKDVVDDDGDVQLNLGLSLGGRFGVDKSHGGLIRSSSVVGALSFIKQDGYQARPPQPMVGVAGVSLPRTASLPVETEEEWRKRKQQQTLRRMEAKKRRSEKRSNIIKESGEGRENEASFRQKLERVQQCASAVNKLSVSASLPTWTAAGCGAKKSELGDGVVLDGLKVRRSFFSSLHGLLAQEGSSTGRYQGGSVPVPVPDSRRTQGSSTDARTPARTTSDIIRCRSYGMEIEDNVKQAAGTAATNKMRETSTGLEDMPCVFTIGDGPNGRKVDGILYKYGKGEEVRIMCVCHGAFFTPVEFVKHAGGCDVQHPLRHIVVNPSSSAFQ